MKKLIIKGKYDFRANYYADSNGHIWSENKQDYMTEYEDKNGYKKVLLMTKDKPPGKGHRFSVHRLVLSTFNPVKDMEKLTVDHIDGDIKNNSLENLKWATIQENLNNPNTKANRRCYDQDGTHNPCAAFDEKTLLELVKDVNSGCYKRKEVLEKYRICDETLRKIILKRTYQKELENININPLFIKSSGDTSNPGEKNGRAKLNNKQVLEIIKLLLTKKYTNKEIAKMYSVSKQIIDRIEKKETWKHLTKNITFN